MAGLRRRRPLLSADDVAGESPPARTPSMKNLRQIGFTLLLIVAAGTTGFVAYHRFASSEAELGHRRPDGSWVAAATRVPELTLLDLDGKPHPLAQWKGRPLIINFWATW